MLLQKLSFESLALTQHFRSLFSFFFVVVNIQSLVLTFVVCKKNVLELFLLSDTDFQ